MERIVLQVIHGHRQHAEFKSFDQDAVTIGRGFANDLILEDPFMADAHAVIRRQEGKIIIQDQGSENSIYLPKIKQTIKEAVIPSGTEFVLGKTRFKMFLASHEVAPEEKIQPAHPLLNYLKNPVITWGLVFFELAWIYLEGHWGTTKNEGFVKLMAWPIFGLLFILGWAGFWSFIGRMTRHKTFFTVHVCIVALWFLVSGIWGLVISYAGYYSNSEELEALLSYILQGSLFMGVLYLCVSFATNMTVKKRVIFAITFTIAFLSIAGALAVSFTEQFAIGAPYNSVLKPPVFGSPKGKTIQAFISNNKSVFP